MGLSMEFYAGSPDDIGRAFTECNLDVLRDGSLAYACADLSLHLSPDHLDLLSEEVAASNGREPVLLFDSLERHVGGIEGESSADVVTAGWVAAIAATPYESIPVLARRWLSAVAEDVGNPSIGEDAT